MGAARLPYTLTYRALSSSRAAAQTTIPAITLVTAPGAASEPVPIDSDRFVADE